MNQPKLANETSLLFSSEFCTYYSATPYRSSRYSVPVPINE